MLPGSEAADTGLAEGGPRDIPANQGEAGLNQQVLQPRTFRADRAVAREGCLKEDGGVTPGSERTAEKDQHRDRGPRQGHWVWVGTLNKQKVTILNV